MNLNTASKAGQIIGTMNGLQVIGLDIAKHVFQLHSVDMSTGEIINIQIKRAKVRLGNISKRGDTYLRTLIIHGARSVLAHTKEPGPPWLDALKGRRPASVVLVAQAAKMARTIWAVTAKEQDYKRDFQSVRPAAAAKAAVQACAADQSQFINPPI